MWIIVLFALFAGNNGGGLFGGGNATQAANMGTISNDFMFNNLHQDMNYGFADVNNALGDISTAVCGIGKDVLTAANTTNMAIAQNGYQNQVGFMGVNKDILTSSNVTNMAIAQNGYQTQIGLLGVERSVEAGTYAAAKNTCEIIQAQNASTQAILNKMDAIEMQNLRDKLCETRDELSNAKQSAYLINQIKPCPMPAYLTSSPYASFGYEGNYGCC